MEKWLTLGLGQKINKMSLEYLPTPESKTARKQMNNGLLLVTADNDGYMLKGSRRLPKEVPMAKAGTI